MGYREEIDNIKIKPNHEKFQLIQNDVGLKINSITRIREDRNVYKLELDDQDVRLDIVNKSIKYKMIKMKNTRIKNKYLLTKEYHNLIYNNGVHIPKFINMIETPKRLYKISEWIDGIRINEIWDSLKIFEKCGEEIAKLNLIKDPRIHQMEKLYFGFKDISPLNFIWTKQHKIYIIDLEFRLKPINVIEERIAKTLHWLMVDDDKIKSFLNGYKKHRKIKNIIKTLNKEYNQEVKFEN